MDKGTSDMRYVAIINDVREQERILVRKKHMPPGVEALPLDDNGHVWLIRGEITTDKIKTVFRRRGHVRQVEDKQVMVYDAPEHADKTLTANISESESPVSILATFPPEQENR